MNDAPSKTFAGTEQGQWDARLTKQEWQLIQSLRTLGDYEDIVIKRDKDRLVYTVTSKTRFVIC